MRKEEEVLKKSYEAYLRQREKWESKGYGMRGVESFDQYKEDYRDAKKIGMKNIARTLAADDRNYTYSDAMKIWKEIKQEREKKKDFLGGYNGVKDIYGAKVAQDVFYDFIHNGYSRERFEGIY